MSLHGEPVGLGQAWTWKTGNVNLTIACLGGGRWLMLSLAYGTLWATSFNDSSWRRLA